MGCEELPEDAPGALDALLEPSESIGDFHLIKGFGPKPIDFGSPVPWMHEAWGRLAENGPYED